MKSKTKKKPSRPAKRPARTRKNRASMTPPPRRWTGWRSTLGALVLGILLGLGGHKLSLDDLAHLTDLVVSVRQLVQVVKKTDALSEPPAKPPPLAKRRR